MFDFIFSDSIILLYHVHSETVISECTLKRSRFNLLWEFYDLSGKELSVFLFKCGHEIGKGFDSFY